MYLILTKKVSESQKKEILNSFRKGRNINVIAKDFNFSSQTIVRQIKNMIGVEEFIQIKEKNLINKNKSSLSSDLKCNNIIKDINHNDDLLNSVQNDINPESSFLEIVPLTEGVELEIQKDLSSEPLEEANLPKVVYLLVDNKKEISPKLLGDYPQWSFMPENDLKRLTIEIFADQKYGKNVCSKNEKLIRVPNSNVFLMASKFLKLKGISRIIFDKVLLSI